MSAAPQPPSPRITPELLQDTLVELHAVFRLRRLAASQIVLIMLKSADHAIAGEVGVLWVGKKLVQPQTCALISSIRSQMKEASEGGAWAFAFAFDGEHHESCLQDGPIPVTLGQVATLANQAFALERTRIEDAIVNDKQPGLNQTQKRQLQGQCTIRATCPSPNHAWL